MLVGVIVVACSCSGPIDQLVVPEPGTVDVPTTARVLAVGNAPELSLETAAGDPVAIDIGGWTDVFGWGQEDWVVATPLDPLSPASEYVVVVDGAPAGTFTTGAGPDAGAPSFAGLRGMTASVFPGSSLCWTRDSLHQVTLDYDSFPADMMFGVLSVRREGEPEPFFTLPVRDRPLNDNFPMPTTIASTICGPNAPELVARDVYCATLAAYDASGNVAGGDAEVCAVAQACAETDLLSAACEPAPDEPASSGGCALSQRPGGRQATIVLLLFAIALRRRRSRA